MSEPTTILPPQQFTAPPMQLGLAPDATPAGSKSYVVGGEEATVDNRIVAVTIGCNCDIRVGEREFTAHLAMHEIAVAKKFYQELGGDLRLHADWPPGLGRHRQLRQVDLLRELERMRGAYRIPRENRVVEILPQFFGAEPAEQARRVHKLMREQFDAWQKLRSVVAKRFTAKIEERGGSIAHLDQAERESAGWGLATEQEVEEIALIADQSQASLDAMSQLVLEASADPAPKPASPGKPAPAKNTDDEDAVDLMLRRLEGLGIPPAQALTVASLVDLHGGAGKIPDEAIIQATGTKAKLGLIREALKG